jgi:hypothetical protein
MQETMLAAGKLRFLVPKERVRPSHWSRPAGQPADHLARRMPRVGISRRSKRSAIPEVDERRGWLVT